MAVKKTRADIRLVEQGLVESRTRAQARILAGQVFWDSRRIEKAGDQVPEDAVLRVTELERYCSRGGKKLEGALLDLGVDVTGVTAVDVGASTGGFTDCVLQHGAARVYAVDVGHGQLAEKLRQDPRVVVMDRTNARQLTAGSFPEPIGLTLVDASFISLDKLLPAIAAFLPSGGRLLALIKPQFEVGREEATRSRGVVSDEAVRSEAVARALAHVEAAGFSLVGDARCRVPGPQGNVEHFVLARRN
ncbi:MAG TPA: TlyA family RNA methyltransferase [Polyangiaceae bacterium]|nr:TlyA family RNA methyltransferase [Polyangiaceae bacterium]